MGKLVEKLKSGHLQVELALGFSIVALASANAWLLTEPLGYLEMSISSLFLICYEGLARNPKTKNSRFVTPVIWTIAIIVATVVIIVMNMF